MNRPDPASDYYRGWPPHEIELDQDLWSAFDPSAPDDGDDFACVEKGFSKTPRPADQKLGLHPVFADIFANIIL